MSKVLVVGGGAAGMLAAIGAARQGAQVTLAERNEKLGKKVYITGKGRCNVTNDCEPDAFQKNVVKNPRFLYSALALLPPSGMMRLLEELGCPVVTERGGRVFPQSQKASDVTRALEREMKRLGVTVLLDTRVKALRTSDGRVTGVTTQDGRSICADAVVVSTGGQSYPSTGSTGDGWGWLKDSGHTVYPPLPSLVGLTTDAQWVKDLQGLSLKNVRLTLASGKKTLYSDIGEMLFTHYGYSGPLVLSASAYAAELDPSEYRLTLDLKPGLSAQQLDARILREIDTGGKRRLRTMLGGLYPQSLADAMPALCGLDGDTLLCELKREAREALVAAGKALTLPVTGARPIDEAVVTRGGVSVKDVNPATMESRKVRGLYLCGELLDVDALTGGFNLQIAFCTGYLAGISAGTSQ